MTPLEDFTNAEPATEDRAYRAMDWLVHHAREIGVAKAWKETADHLVKVAESRAFLKAEGSNDVRRAEARASDDYMDALDQYEKAAAEFEILYATRVAAEAVISMFQTVSANQRRV